MALCLFVFQVPPVQHTDHVGSPPGFAVPIMLSPTAMPPPGAPFISTDFDPANLTAGKDIYLG